METNPAILSPLSYHSPPRQAANTWQTDGLVGDQLGFIGNIAIFTTHILAHTHTHSDTPALLQPGQV